MDNVFDIDIEFNNIIEKYEINILEWDPINEVIEKYSKFNNIALRCAGGFTKKFLKRFNDKIRIKAIFDSNPESVSDEILSYGIPVKSCEKIKDEKWEVMIISTEAHKDEIKKELSNYNIENIVDLSEELKNILGVKVNSEFAVNAYDNYCYIVEAKLAYKNSSDKLYKEKLLRGIIASFLYNRDILSVNKMILEYIENKYTDWEKYERFLIELNDLMDKIKAKLSSRNFKDVIILWQDALMYKSVEDMPFEKSCRDKGLFFQNARGVTPWTRAAMKAVLDKRLCIDDYYFERKTDGHLLTELFKENGYDCRYTNGYQDVDLHRNYAVESQKESRVYAPITKVYWDLLKCLTINDKPIMILAHSILESHAPNYSPNLEYFLKNDELLKFDNENRIEIRKLAVSYVDEQTEYIMNILNENSTKIIMSDHGTLTSKKSRKWDYDNSHINFLVFGGGIKPRECTKLFSLTNFYELAKYILKPSLENFSGIFSEEVYNQSTPTYNSSLVSFFIEIGFEEWGVAYRAIETLKDRFVLMETGKEIYNILPDEKTNYINDERYKDRIDYLREKAGNKFIDFNKEPELKYSHLLYDSLKAKERA